MSDRTRSAHQQQADARDRTAVAVAVERLPYHPSIQDRFGVDRTTWRALVEAVFPAAKTVEGVILALSYCRARGLDPMKRPVHVVPIWDKDKRAYVESVWPGIGEQRTTAFRTKQYAGCDETKFGPTVVGQFSGMTGRDGQQRQQTIEVTYPEWAQLTVYRMLGGNRIAMPGPRVYWLETYARLGRTDLPNEMWQKRPFGQIEKCCESAALRRAFPEEVGNEPSAEEMGADDNAPTLDMTADGDFRTGDAQASAPTAATPSAQPKHVDPPAAKPRQEPRQPVQRAPAAKAPAQPHRQPEPAQEPPAGQFDDAPPATAPAATTDGFQAFLAAPDGTDLRAEPYTDPVTFAQALAAASLDGFTTREIWECNLAAVEDAVDASPEARSILNAHHKAMVDAEVAAERQPPAASEPEPAAPAEDPDRRKLADRIADMNACRTMHELTAWNETMVVKTFGQRMKVDGRDDILNELRAAYVRKKEELTVQG